MAAVEILKKLISYKSVTPASTDIFDYIDELLKDLGFKTNRLIFEEDHTSDVENLYAKVGVEKPHLSFAGHLDVVPEGDSNKWSADAYSALEKDGRIYGRGAVDMKGAIAAFIAAYKIFKVNYEGKYKGSVSLILTGDEEGPGINGTKKMLQWLEERADIPDNCIVGEPTCAHEFGDSIKVGRRGSLSMKLHVHGKEGHSAYPHLANNPIHLLVEMLEPFIRDELDQGSEFFLPSHMQITSIKSDNEAVNVIPSNVTALINSRLNDNHSYERFLDRLNAHFSKVIEQYGGSYEIEVLAASNAFKADNIEFAELLNGAIKKVTKKQAKYTTTGGTSDARFIKDYCPVIEFGLLGQTMHQANEFTETQHMEELCEIYYEMLVRYFIKSN